MSDKLSKVFFYLCLTSIVILLSAPKETDSKRVIFYAPRHMEVVTGQILSSRAKDKPCPKCQMRDHRGQCRRILSFKSNGAGC